MRKFIEFFLSIRDSKFFTGLVISVIVASAIYAGASSYDIPNQYTVIWIILIMPSQSSF